MFVLKSPLAQTVYVTFTGSRVRSKSLQGSGPSLQRSQRMELMELLS